MRKSQTGNLALSAACALLAGVLGSLLTLLVTGKMAIPAPQGHHANDTTTVLAVPDVVEDETLALFQSTDDNPLDRHHEYEELLQAIQAATEERAQLASSLSRLVKQVDDLESDLINQQGLSLALSPAASSNESQQSAASAGVDFSDNVADSGTQDVLESLVAAGLDYDSAQALRIRQDQYQLARLELVDQAEREGWRESEQFSDRLSALQEQRPDLRAELGDDAYDRYLFEAGQSNRVSIVSIIPGSEAELAGLLVGDTVFSYADERVFTTRDLQRATREGQRGELVSMRIERQGQAVFIDVARGPLGVSLNPEQRNPS